MVSPTDAPAPRHRASWDEYFMSIAQVVATRSTCPRHRLAYAQDQAGRGWDRKWRLVSFAIPETRRSARDAFRDRLLALGGAAISAGVYVSPHRWEKDVRAEADRLDLTAEVTQASTDDLDVGGTTDPRDPLRASCRTRPASSSRRRCGRSVLGCSESRVESWRTGTARPDSPR
jgi:hypothetical protein